MKNMDSSNEIRPIANEEFEELNIEFEKFKKRFGKTYADYEEESLRKMQFKENLKNIEQHNSEGHSWRMGVTEFSDLSQ